MAVTKTKNNDEDCERCGQWDCYCKIKPQQSTTQHTDEMREAFERWALMKFECWRIDEILLKRKDDGDYLVTNVQDSWRGYQAAAASYQDALRGAAGIMQRVYDGCPTAEWGRAEDYAELKATINTLLGEK